MNPAPKCEIIENMEKEDSAKEDTTPITVKQPFKDVHSDQSLYAARVDLTPQNDICKSLEERTNKQQNTSLSKRKHCSDDEESKEDITITKINKTSHDDYVKRIDEAKFKLALENMTNENLQTVDLIREISIPIKMKHFLDTKMVMVSEPNDESMGDEKMVEALPQNEVNTNLWQRTTKQGNPNFYENEDEINAKRLSIDYSEKGNYEVNEESAFHDESVKIPNAETHKQKDATLVTTTHNVKNTTCFEEEINTETCDNEKDSAHSMGVAGLDKNDKYCCVKVTSDMKTHQLCCIDVSHYYGTRVFFKCPSDAKPGSYIIAVAPEAKRTRVSSEYQATDLPEAGSFSKSFENLSNYDCIWDPQRIPPALEYILREIKCTRNDIEPLWKVSHCVHYDAGLLKKIISEKKYDLTPSDKDSFNQLFLGSIAKYGPNLLDIAKDIQIDVDKIIWYYYHKLRGIDKCIHCKKDLDVINCKECKHPFHLKCRFKRSGLSSNISTTTKDHLCHKCEIQRRKFDYSYQCQSCNNCKRISDCGKCDYCRNKGRNERRYRKLLPNQKCLFKSCMESSTWKAFDRNHDIDVAEENFKHFDQAFQETFDMVTAFQWAQPRSDPRLIKNRKMIV